MNFMPEKNRMKNIFNNLIKITAWLTGAVFFFLLVVYNAISFFANGFRRLFKWKGLYNFREEEFQALNVIYDTKKNIPIGALPTARGKTSAYYIPLNAKEILLEFKFAPSSDSCVELDYCLSGNDSASRKEYVYIFMNPFSDSLNLNYDKALVWYPLPEDHILKVQFADIKPVADALKNIEGHLNVVQVR